MKPINRSKLSLLLVLLSVLLSTFVTGCSEPKSNRKMPSVLKIGILPDQGREALLKRYTPLFTYLSEKLDRPYEVVIPESYADLLALYGEKKIDIAYFGGYTFIQANEKFQAKAVVMRDVDVRFNSYFIARGNSNLGNISDYKGKKFAFGSKLSTSGHLMPRYFLQKKNINPEQFFDKIEYAGSHDKTAMMVQNGFVDIGVANSKIIKMMFEDGRLNKDLVTVIWETPPYPDYVWAAQFDFEPSVIIKIRDAFLSLSPLDQKHVRILSKIDAGGFLPASRSDFSRLAEIAENLGLVKTTD